MMYAITGFIGVYCIMGFMQSTRLGFYDRVLSILNPLQFLALVSILWAVALEVRWWAVLVFFAGSFAAGTANALILQSKGKDRLLMAQPLRALVFITIGIGIWMPIAIR